MEKKHTRRDSDIPLSKVGLVLHLAKKHGIMGTLAASAMVMSPMVVDLYGKWSTKQDGIIINRAIEPLHRELIKMNGILLKSRAVAIEAHGKNVLSAEDIDYIARMAVAKQSIHKVKEIKVLLDDIPEPISETDVDRYHKRLEQKMKNILISNSKVYVRDLNKYQHISIGNVGDYIWNNFPMDSFMDNVNQLVLHSNSEDSGVIADDVMEYMLSAQTVFFDKMYRVMKKELR